MNARKNTAVEKPYDKVTPTAEVLRGQNCYMLIAQRGKLMEEILGEGQRKKMDPARNIYSFGPSTLAGVYTEE